MPAAIKFVTDFVERPVMVAYCDQACGCYVSLECADGISVRDNITRFVAKCDLEGWVIGLLGNLCEKHAAALRDQQRRIVEPGAGLIQ